MPHPRIVALSLFLLLLTLTLGANHAEGHPWSCDTNTPTTDAPSDADLMREWRASPAMRRYVGRFDNYKNLRPLYRRAGICDVPLFMSKGIVTASFLGRPLKIHTALSPLLAKASEALSVPTPRRRRKLRFKSVGTFHPRAVRTPYGTLDQLSKHGLGLAIDIDPLRNPFLSNEDLAALEAVSGVHLKRSYDIPAGERWDSFQEAAQKYRTRVRTWTREAAALLAAQPEQTDLKALLTTVKTSRRLAKLRHWTFLSLPREFVVVMENVGLTWATNFPTGADLMHFEHRTAP